MMLTLETLIDASPSAKALEIRTRIADWILINGMCSYWSWVTVWTCDLQSQNRAIWCPGPIPVVKHIMIPADMDGHIPVDLEMAMPLYAFLAPVCCTSSLYSYSVWSFVFDGYILCSMQLKSIVCVILVFNFWNWVLDYLGQGGEQ